MTIRLFLADIIAVVVLLIIAYPIEGPECFAQCFTQFKCERVYYMKLNEDKCNFLLAGSKNEHFFANIVDAQIWESNEEYLLGNAIDSNLKFSAHLKGLLKKVSQKISALNRVSRYI